MRIETRLKLTDDLIFFKITSVLVLKMWYSQYCRVLFCFVEEQLFLSIGKYIFFFWQSLLLCKNVHSNIFETGLKEKKIVGNYAFFTEIEYMIYNILKTGPFYHLRDCGCGWENWIILAMINSKKASKRNETNNTI